ncbi:MAG: lipid A deacylase LpxR family protein [Halofilum sp. (in: g-proteobacteria)]|nr:lipid A deacylase LpxR family protein [Halofilum sp. (in: g-proteobacteria)]
MRKPVRTDIRAGAALGTVLALLAMPSSTLAGSASEGPPDAPLGPEPRNTGWSFYLDNDALTLVNRDQQYTGGFALTLSGRRAVEYPVSIDSWLGRINDITGFSRLTEGSRRTTRHSIEFGATSFTPEEIERPEPIRDDHPYANVVFMSNTRQTVLLDKRVSYQSTLLVGLLGTDFAKGMQNLFHNVTGDQKPRGWDNQISDGGEPTFMYVVTRQQPLWLDDDRRGFDYDIRTTLGASAGYVTQAGAGITWRFGRIRTPWWGFNPDFAEYINFGTPVAGSKETAARPRELFLWGTLQVRQRFYNAILEGQFRDSEVTFDRSELDSTLGEAAFGVTLGLRSGYRVTAALRAREPELEDADGLDPVWGSVIVSRSFSRTSHRYAKRRARRCPSTRREGSGAQAYFDSTSSTRVERNAGLTGRFAAAAVNR